jgi:hypothetical protein
LAEGTCTLIYLEVQTVFGDLSGSIMYGLDTVIHAATNRTAKIAQRAKKVKVHFKPLLCQAFSNLTGQLSIVQNPIPYVDFMHDEFGKASRTKDQH